MSQIQTDAIQGIIAPQDIPPAPRRQISIRYADFLRTIEVHNLNKELPENNLSNWVIGGSTVHSTIFRAK